MDRGNSYSKMQQIRYALGKKQYGRWRCKDNLQKIKRQDYLMGTFWASLEKN
jgi:hypothetical protein